jgi:ribosome-binding protein aMBF1 (putative translation factor)
MSRAGEKKRVKAPNARHRMPRSADSVPKEGSRAPEFWEVCGTLARNLRGARRSQGLGVKRLANLAKVPTELIEALEAWKIMEEVTMSEIHRLARALSVPLPHLLDRAGTQGASRGEIPLAKRGRSGAI